MPWASVAPAASAAAFLATPESSTPTGSLDCSQTTPARMKTPAIGGGELDVGGRGDEPGALGDHLARVGGAADAADAIHAAGLVEQAVGDSPSGGTRPLASEITGVRDGQAGGVEVADHLGQPARGHAEEDVVGAREAGGHRLDAQLARELDLGQVGLVLAVGLQARGLLGRAGLQRRAEAAAGEQDGDRGAERAGADDDGAALAAWAGTAGAGAALGERYPVAPARRYWRPAVRARSVEYG